MPRDGEAPSADIWLSFAELVELRLPGLPVARRSLDDFARRKGWLAPEYEGGAWRRRQGKGGGVELSHRVLPPEALAALLLQRASAAPAAVADRSPPTWSSELWSWFERQPDRLKDRARRRMEVLMHLHRQIDAGTRRLHAIHLTAQHVGISRSQIYAWEALVEGKPRSDWLPALAPRHAGGRPKAEVPPEAWTFLCSLYLRPSPAPAQEAIRLTREKAAEAGWALPSDRTLLRELSALPKPLVTLERQGEEALKRSLPSLRRDRGVFGALEAINGDGHKWDVTVRWEDGTESRPETVAFQDVYSGKILAWRTDQTLSWHLVRLAFGDLVERWGIPEHCWLDNGREFAAKKITGGTRTRYRFRVRDDEPMGLMTQLGVQVHWTQPYWGQSKPIERAFGDFSRSIATHPAFDGAYTGNTPLAKPHNYGTRAVPIAEFHRVVAERIAEHNARPGRRSPTCQGRSFDQTFAESYAGRAITRATDAQRRLWLLAAESIAVRRDGRIALLGNEWWDEALLGFAGQRVVVRFDPAALHQPIHVETADGRHVCTAPVWEAGGFNDAAAAQRVARIRKGILRNERDTASKMGLLSAAELARALPAFEAADPPPEPRVVRPIFGNTAAAARPIADEEDDDAFAAALAAQRRQREHARGPRLVEPDDDEDG
jgi:hypothetical protein